MFVVYSLVAVPICLKEENFTAFRSILPKLRQILLSILNTVSIRDLKTQFFKNGQECGFCTNR